MRLEMDLIHIKGTVDFDLQSVPPERRATVVFSDITARIGLIPLDPKSEIARQ